MDCQIYLGAMRILFEDLGFTYRDNPEEQRCMSYHCYARDYYDKIFADINPVRTIEMFLGPQKICLDHWYKSDNGLFIVNSEINLNIYDPNSIPSIIEFVKETLRH